MYVLNEDGSFDTQTMNWLKEVEKSATNQPTTTSSIESLQNEGIYQDRVVDNIPEIEDDIDNNELRSYRKKHMHSKGCKCYNCILLIKKWNKRRRDGGGYEMRSILKHIILVVLILVLLYLLYTMYKKWSENKVNSKSSFRVNNESREGMSLVNNM